MLANAYLCGGHLILYCFQFLLLLPNFVLFHCVVDYLCAVCYWNVQGRREPVRAPGHFIAPGPGPPTPPTPPSS